MGTHSGFATGWDKHDLTDVRNCGKCGRKMRHRHAVPELFPDTVPHRANGVCSGCSVAPPHLRRAKTPEEDARRIAAAQQVALAIRARRQARGITPDGKMLPRRVLSE
jgi:hypothetical protein